MSKLKKYLITIGMGLAMALWVAYTKGAFAQTDTAALFHILTDSFFVPAVLITGMGLLVFVSNEGAFDGLTFAVSSFINVFRKEKKNQYTTYYDYKKSKGDRDRSFGFMIVVGLGFMAITGIMLLIYEMNI
jgi:hypothetical protein